MRAKAVPKRADLPAMRRSQASASPSPAPATGPLMLAITTFGIVRNSNGNWWAWRKPSTRSSTVWSRPRLSIVLTSPPAHQPRPAPVITIAPQSRSVDSRSSASFKPAVIAGDSAVSRSGRFRVRVVMPFSVVSSRSDMGLSWRDLADHSPIYFQRTLLAQGAHIRPSGVPAKAGIHFSTVPDADEWVPAFAGTPGKDLA